MKLLFRPEDTNEEATQEENLDVSMKDVVKVVVYRMEQNYVLESYKNRMSKFGKLSIFIFVIMPIHLIVS